MNRRMPNGTYGGVGGSRCETSPYPISSPVFTELVERLSQAVMRRTHLISYK